MFTTAVRILVLTTAAAATVACSSTATPRTAAQYAPKVVVTGTQPVSTARPTIANSGTYPTFGPPITAANSQMDDSEATRIQAQMASLAASRNAGAVTEAEYQRQLADLKRLAATHGAAMQAKIEN